jgi:acyl transferase domain-containing protein
VVKKEENIDYRALMTNALVALKQTKQKLAEVELARNEPIAIVGMGCRFPGGANNPEAYWDMLSKGAEGIAEIPTNRWDVEYYYDAQGSAPGKIYTRGGGFISDIDKFDPQFFGISAREAMFLDPQHRVIFETARTRQHPA